MKCKCKHEHSARCKRSMKCKCGVKCKHEHEAKYECKHEARAQGKVCKVGCIIFIPPLSVCTGDISTKAMVGADIVAQMP